MTNFYIAGSADEGATAKLTLQTNNSQIIISASKDALLAVDPSEINEKAATVVCSVGGLQHEETIALLRLARDGISTILRQITL
jgi:hypothetical protein